MIIYHDAACTEYSAAGHPEGPLRITRTVPILKGRHPAWEWREPDPATDDQLLRAHSRDHLELIAKPGAAFDVDTPAYSKIDLYARQSAGAAIQAASMALAGQKAFSLMRPPGHHAMRNRAMGFCYFGNIAVAALNAIAGGGGADARPGPTIPAAVQRVAIWDFDAHHGNGTEDIVAHNSQIRFASIHQYPAYPGTGAESFANIDNYPVAPGTRRKEHIVVVRRALDKLLEFKPNLLLVSAGFDAYARDPLVRMTLEQEEFVTFGEWLRQIDIPAAAILEGGYSNDLPELIDAFLTAWGS